MAMLDISVVNSALPVIQGEIGATQSEGTWIGTAYLTAEIVVIPLTGWFDRMLGLRRFLLIASIWFVGFSMLCGIAPDLNTMILGRVGQGLAGGAMIPTAMTIMATRLPPAQQAIGMACFAAAALLGPIVGPLLGGWMTEHYSWRYAFFMNLPICAGLVVLLLMGLKHRDGDWQELRRADWAGIAGMVLGLGGLTVLLEEGHREQWFDSGLIRALALVSVTGFALVAAGQRLALRPVIRLSLLRNRSLAAVVCLMLVAGGLMFSTMFAVPQFLATIAGNNALQSGQVIAMAGGTAIFASALFPVLVSRVDVRLLVGGAFLVQAGASLMATHLSPMSDGATFSITMVLLGLGLTLAALPLQQVAISSVPAEDAGEASSLYVVARNMGASVGLAAVASFQDQRLELHHWQLHAGLAANDGAVQGQLAQYAGQWGGGPEGLVAAYRLIDNQVLREALVMSFNDVFMALATATLLVMPMVLLLRPISSARAGGMGH
ncbi:DHA2 family efflux MFS transporter permease subunit [Novosphingobium sp. FSY-8]|uniref:DHA2 family efflux MFS transporter permease subunit n=2 Tax=Novosphingobium ovatum TaxID=1908523 RepID=A0ABW9XBR3_9SPHN|nr:DHA2 family efflux MFS transporter permease subunit [Novosphingobium ovatum]